MRQKARGTGIESSGHNRIFVLFCSRCEWDDNWEIKSWMPMSTGWRRVSICAHQLNSVCLFLNFFYSVISSENFGQTQSIRSPNAMHSQFDLRTNKSNRRAYQWIHHNHSQTAHVRCRRMSYRNDLKFYRNKYVWHVCHVCVLMIAIQCTRCISPHIKWHILTIMSNH